MIQNLSGRKSKNWGGFLDNSTVMFSATSIALATMTAPKIAKLRFLAEFENASMITMKMTEQVNRMRK